MKHSLPLVLLALIGCAAPAWSAGMADQVSVIDPHVRQAPPGAKVTGAYMTLRNAGDRAVPLVTAGSVAAHITELHNHINDGGVMRMRQVKEIVVPAKGEVMLKPGSYHVMLIDMKAPLKDGDTVAITLGFADGSSKTIDVPVKRPTAAMLPKGDMDHSKMKH
ncbi:MAG: copper chaperone PCu(A)C [Gammaproteobacteria bacterium]|nr:copper chaperone PCu(A)C [Rhodocyclaceae bacterium]MBU3910024.1 copper chaperone PCu(A)C [Gammaproteobacteria bacterium]MBU3989894.1 copper chaperone PCu(A)C [Gammaproteobacteria bacterium]MBU4003997.1 copper chaperone PCu(A)C [Gammaproteobacteria bacterium]MBU4020244.1 copper chaperone PCu(A)C [Gammaproteobacteria bacterium]